MVESIPVNASIHYKCALDVHCSDTDGLTSIRKIIREWGLNKTKSFSNKNSDLTWFFKGDQHQHKVGSFLFRAAINVGDYSLESPANWAFEIIHPDSSNKNRRWSTEVTLSQEDDSLIRFVTTIKHWMAQGYIGPIPDTPSFSVPNYIQSMIETEDIVCRKGDEKAQSKPKVIKAGEGKSLYERIVSSNRFLPIIVITKSLSTDRYLVSSDNLQSKILGNGNIYLLDSEEAVTELNYFLGDDLKCLSGSLRIYMPMYKKTDSFRHRYYSESKLLEGGFDSVASEITIGLSRDARTFRLNEITSISDVISEGRRHKIKELVSSQPKDQSEEVSLLSEEIEVLGKKLSDTDELNNIYGAENEELKQENYNLRGKSSQADVLKSENMELKNKLEAFKFLNKLPKSLSDVVVFFKSSYPSKLFFTDKAIKSTEKYEHGDEVVNQAWEILWHMATTLHEIIFSYKSCDIEDIFRNKSGYKLAMTEGKRTKKDPTFMKLRKVVYLGKEVDITPHVKDGNKPPNIIRVYFYPDKEREIIVVGHCGGHLDNYTTKGLN